MFVRYLPRTSPAAVSISTVTPQSVCTLSYLLSQAPFSHSVLVCSSDRRLSLLARVVTRHLGTTESSGKEKKDATLGSKAGSPARPSNTIFCQNHMRSARMSLILVTSRPEQRCSTGERTITPPGQVPSAVDAKGGPRQSRSGC